MIDNEPLPGRGSTHATHTLVPIGTDRVLLRESFGLWILLLVLELISAGFLTLALGSFPPPNPVGWVLIGFGVWVGLAGLVGAALGMSRTDFDRAAGKVRFRGRFWIWKERPLADVVGVQLIPGGWHKTSSGPDTPARSYFTYQINLILDDDDQPRVNLTNHANWKASWSTANKLAEFLEVPLHDEASDEDNPESGD